MSTEEEQEIPKTKRRQTLKEKIDEPSVFEELIDGIVFVASIWATIVIYFRFKEYIPHLNWPYYLDQVLFGFLLFIVVLLSITALRFFIVLGLVGGIVCLIVLATIEIINRTKDSSAPVAKTGLENISMKQVVNNIINPYPVDSIAAEVRILKAELDSLKKVVAAKDSAVAVKDSVKVKLPVGQVE